MKVMVAGAPEAAIDRRRGPVGITGWVPSSRRHSGQRWPTAASVEQAKQIGRPHLLQLSKVLRSGWR
jgi:hypothetical protein